MSGRAGAFVTRALGLLLALLGAHCERPATAVRVVVYTNLAWGAQGELRSLALTVRSGSPEGALREERVYPLGTGSGEHTMPASFAIVPMGGDDQRTFWVEVRGCTGLAGCSGTTADAGAGQAPVVVARAITGFVPEMTRVLALYLTDSCRGVPCDDPRTTCDPVSRGCVPAFRDPGTLPSITPGFDASTPPRDSSMDTTETAVDVVVPPAPRLVAPLSTARVSSPRPLLRWASDVGAVQVELCQDRACAVREATLDARGTSARPGSDLAPGMHFWRVRPVGGAPGTTWEFSSGRAPAARERVWGSVPDFDGDGRADLAVGAMAASDGAGRAYLFRHGTSGLGASPTTLTGPDERRSSADAGTADGGTPSVSCFGRALANAGDLDGDGYGDLAVAAFCVNRMVGAVWVYRGGASGVGDSPSWVLPNPRNDPERPDRDNPEAFGVTLAGGGDLDGDGYADLVVTAHGDGTSPRAGHTYVYLGGADGPGRCPSPTDRRCWPHVRLVPPGTNTAYFGEGLHAAGDLDGDGASELLVGEGGVDGNSGVVHLYAGGSAWRAAAGGASPPTATTLRAQATAGELGKALGVADLTGDGWQDVVAGGPYGDQEGVDLFSGTEGSPGLITATRTRFQTADRGPAGGQGFFGLRLACEGDFDRDGTRDLAVGAWRSVPSPDAGVPGAVYLFRGGPTPTGGSPQRLVDPAGRVSFGATLSAPGDLDGDGVDDLAVGVPGDVSSPDAGPGVVLLFRGSADGGLGATPFRTLQAPGMPSGDFFGWALAR